MRRRAESTLTLADFVPMAYSANEFLGKERALPTRNVVLTEQQTAMIERLVHSGRYQNASEVLRDGLRLVRRQHASRRSARQQELDCKISRPADTAASPTVRRCVAIWRREPARYWAEVLRRPPE